MMNNYFLTNPFLPPISPLTLGRLSPAGPSVTPATTTLPLLGIDLGGSGTVLPNHSPNTADGPNDLQNYPVITSAVTALGQTTIRGTISSHQNSTYRIEFDSNTIGPSFRAGQVVLGAMLVTTNATGQATFTFNSPILVPVGQYVTTTATWMINVGTTASPTNEPAGTSEFSDVVPIGSTVPPLTGPLEFSKPSYSVNETAGFLAVTINRVGRTAGTIRATFQTADGTAQAADGDYKPVRVTLTFSPGVKSRTVRIPILDTHRRHGKISLSLNVTNIQGSSNGTTPVSAPLTIVDNDAASDAVGPRVTGIKAYGTGQKASRIVLSFDAPLDANRANDAANYQIQAPGPGKSYGTPVAIQSVRYNASGHTVTILTAAPLNLRGASKYQLTVRGLPPGGLTDVDGAPLNGSGNRRTPGDYVKVLTKAVYVNRP
jgi:hypothetical protein